MEEESRPNPDDERPPVTVMEAEVAMLPERPYEAIRQAADEYDARFIVVGSYGERPIRGALLGAVPYKLLHTSETPVVVVRV